MNIRTKTVLLICITVLFFIAVGMGGGYLYMLNSMQSKSGEDYRGMAEILTSSISGIIDKETGLIKLNASDVILKNAVQESNSKYQADAKTTQDYLASMDKKWTENSSGSPFQREYLDNNPSFILKSVMTEDEKITGIILTDKYGGLVGAAGNAPGFYYGNKNWWLEAFDGGKGKICLGDIALDETTNVWSIPFVAPVKDDNGEVIGIYRLTTDLGMFFGPLESFRVGKTGRANLVDDKGYLVFGVGTPPFSGKFCSYKELQKVLRSKSGWHTIDSAYLHNKGALTAFAKIDHPLLAESAINWWVFIVQDSKEMYEILHKSINNMTIFAGILMIVLIFVGLMVSRIPTGPITKLQEGMGHISRGDLNYKVEAQTGDEIGRLVQSFNEMADNLKKIMAPKSDLDREHASRKIAEEKVTQLNSDLVSIISRLRALTYIAKQEIEAILKETPGSMSEKQKKMISAAEGTIDRLAKVVDNLLDVTKIEAGKMELKRTVVDIRALLKNIVFVFEPQIRSKGLSLKLDIPKESVSLYIDTNRIQQVLGHLLENALRFTENGYVEISAKDTKNGIECSVTDTGIGIFTDSIPKIFEKSGKIGPGVEPAETGAGLGLFVVKGIIEAHEGKIWVESNPGKGTKVTFRLPKQKEINNQIV